MTRLGLVLLAAVAAASLVGCGAPAPDGLTAQEVAFVERVASIAPPLAEDPERVARRGANSCSDLAAGDEEQALTNAVERFSGGSYTVSEAEAEQLLAAAAETVCAAS